jgi:NADPH:quinone reductase
MKALVIREFGGPEVMRLEEVPDLVPGPGEVVVAVHAVSVNYTLDVTVRSGNYARGTPLPHILGVDPSGVVLAIGAGVDRVAVGDRVNVQAGIRCEICEFCVAGRQSECTGGSSLGVNRWGGYGEQVKAPQQVVYPIPDTLNFADATVITRHFPTARHMLHKRAELQPGEWILVMGAAGGLGSSSIQVAKQMGATVVAAAGTDERVQTGLDFGADYGVNYRSQDLAAEVGRLTDGRGVQVVAENIGDPDLWPGAFNSLAARGRLVTAGAHGGGTVPLDISRLYLRRIKILGSPGCDTSDIEWSLEQAHAGNIRAAKIDRIMPLHEADEAHRLMERRETSGKLILDPTLSRDQPTV